MTFRMIVQRPTSLLLLACLLLVSSANALAARLDTVRVSDTGGHYSAAQALRYIEDKTGQLTINDIASPAYADKFLPAASESNEVNFGYSACATRFRTSEK